MTTLEAHDTMQVATTVDEVRDAIAASRRAIASAPDGASVGFVPTMGALHDGHRALMDAARARCDVVVASCYVNPTQFGPTEDLERYPRSPREDAAIARAAGVDVLWLPRDVDVYGARSTSDTTRITVGAIGDVLEGASRPGHFDGVATVVVRLLGAVRPMAVYLGRKDYQQLVIVRRVIEDLLLPVEVRAIATVREPDGLARSSRNAYLSPAERASAGRLPRALAAAAHAWSTGERDPTQLTGIARTILVRDPAIDIDHLAIVHRDSVTQVVDSVPAGATMLLAVRIGSTRLIDNIQLDEGDHHG